MQHTKELIEKPLEAESSFDHRGLWRLDQSHQVTHATNQMSYETCYLSYFRCDMSICHHLVMQARKSGGGMGGVANAQVLLSQLNAQSTVNSKSTINTLQVLWGDIDVIPPFRKI